MIVATLCGALIASGVIYCVLHRLRNRAETGGGGGPFLWFMLFVGLPLAALLVYCIVDEWIRYMDL